VLSRLSAQSLRQRLFALWEQLLTRMSHEHPVLLVIEDAHWADVTSLELVEHLSAVTIKMPITLLGVMRPSGAQSLADLLALLKTRCGDRFSTLTLRPLSLFSGLEMARQLLALGELPERLHALIVDKTEGNPFYVEEVIRSLIERGALAHGDAGTWVVTPLIDTVTVPDTLRGVLMARLDRLPVEAKWLAQQASVIGRIFLYRVLLQMAEAVGDVDTDLDKLEREELIRMGARHPEVEYIFKHALTQEVAYESLLASRRKELHRRVGEAMEQVFAQRPGEFNSIIGEHFLRGEAWSRAVGYLLPAGDAAARMYAHPEARLHYNNALEALSHLPDTAENRRSRVDMLTKYVTISWGAETPEKNFQRLLEAESLLKELPDPDGAANADQYRLARVHYWMGRIQYIRSQPREAIAYYQQVLAVAHSMGDPELVAIPSSFIGQALVVQGHFNKAEPLLRQAIEPLEHMDNLPEWIRAASFHGICLAARGDYAEGLAEVQLALARAKAANFLGGIAISNIYLAFMYLLGQDYARMLDASLIVIETAQQTGDRMFVYLGYGFSAWAEGRMGRAESARKRMTQSQEIERSIGGQLLLTDLFAAADAELYLLSGNAEEALKLVEEAVKYAQTVGGHIAEGIAQRVWGQALVTVDPSRWEDAQAHLDTSVRLLEGGEACIVAAHTHMVWGQLCLDRGYVAAAREHLTRAAEQYEASGLIEALETTKRLLLQLPVHT
jgi:tetratricopeptide (TPR) repeat protein